MATNFEFYKDKIMEIVETNNSIALSNGKPVDCTLMGCGICDFRGDCYKKRYKWLYAEHIEQPKLTKRERAFCEAMQTGWIAKHHDCGVWSITQPEYEEQEDEKWFVHSCRAEKCFFIPFLTFTQLMPWTAYKVEDLLKMDVIEEVQHETD